MSDKAMVAFGDLLGFRSFVKSASLQEAAKFLINLREEVLKGFKNYTLPQLENSVGMVLFSDSVLIYSRTDNNASWGKVIIVAYALLAQTIKHPLARWRIGISYGDFYHDERKNIYVGKAYIEAAELEKKQDWCGGILSKTAAEKALADNIIKREELIVQYDVPIKNKNGSSKSESYHAINWTRAKHNWDNKKGCCLAREFPDSMTKDERDDVERKLKNTEEFHNKVCNCYRAYEKGQEKIKQLCKTFD